MRRLVWTPALLAAGLAILPATAAAEYAPGKGSLGGSLGMPFLYSRQELARGQRPRIIGKLHFQYVFTPSMRLSLRGGFGWLGYNGTEPTPYPFPSDNGGFDTTRVDQLTTIIPASAALVYTDDIGSSRWKWFAGGGLGVYRMNIMNDRKTVYDPVTYDRLKFTSLGATGEVGVEYFLPANKNVSFEWLGTGHFLFATYAGKYPSGYKGRHGFVDFSFGVNVYFNPGSESPPVTLPDEE